MKEEISVVLSHSVTIRTGPRLQTARVVTADKLNDAHAREKQKMKMDRERPPGAAVTNSSHP